MTEAYCAKVVAMLRHTAVHRLLLSEKKEGDDMEKDRDGPFSFVKPAT